MKNIFTIIVIIAFSISAAKAEKVSVSIGAGYANDVWYSLENGIVKTEPSDNWDIAVQTGAKDAGICINSPNGLLLWAVPDSDEDSWDDAIDTTGMSANWETCNNASENWAIGAFNMGLDGFASGGNFGWGEYNMATHSITGNKVFVLQLDKKTYKRIMIESLMAGTYTIKWADLDGSNEKSSAIAKADYAEKMFAYLDITTNQVLDREPPRSSWLSYSADIHLLYRWGHKHKLTLP